MGFYSKFLDFIFWLIDYFLELLGIVDGGLVEEDVFDLSFSELFVHILENLKEDLDDGRRLDYFLLVDGSICCFSLYKNESLSKWVIKYSGEDDSIGDGILSDDLSVLEVLEFLKVLAHQKAVNLLKRAFTLRKQVFKERLLNSHLSLITSTVV